MTNRKLSDVIYAACELADRWRTAGYGWPRLIRTMLERGWYGISERDGKVVAYLNGVRFEL